ncbi:MAG: hypothetical protein ABL866_09880 [Devosia sp.]
MSFKHLVAAAAILTLDILPAAAVDSFDLGGAATGSPATVAYKFAGKDAVAVFVRGPGGLMYAQVGTGDGGTWTGWAPIGALVLTSSPSCTARSATRIDCAAVGPGNNVYWTSYDAKANKWTGWANLGGAASSDPSVIRTSEGGKTQLRIFVRGPLNHLFINTLEDGNWSDWQDVGGVIGPALACVKVFKLGAHCYDTTATGVRQLADVTHKTGVDIAIEDLGGAVTGKASAVNTTNAVRVFVMGPGHKLWVKTWEGGWSDWSQTPASQNSAPGCAMDSTGTQAWCASIGPAGAVTMNLLDESEL